MRKNFTFLSCLVAATFCIAFVGCTPKAPTEKNSADTNKEEHDHAAHNHPTEGPHGGHLIELGNEEYHAELLHNEETKTITIHLLDGAGKKSVVVPVEKIALQLFQDGKLQKYELKAVHQPKDDAKNASQFEVVNAKLCDTLCHGTKVKGRLQVTIKNKSYVGTIEHTAHSHNEEHQHTNCNHQEHNQDAHNHEGGSH